MATTAKSVNDAKVQSNAPVLTVSKGEKGESSNVETTQQVSLVLPPSVNNKDKATPGSIDFSFLMEKTEKLYLLKEKYEKLSGKRKSLDLFAISHDSQNAQIQIVDAAGQSFESSNPKCIKEVIDIWKKDFSKAIDEVEKEIRSLYAK